MKIGINARLLLPHRMEGIAKYSWEITRRMILAHPEDEFVLFFDRPFDKQFLISDNVQAVKIGPPSRHPILWKMWFDISLRFGVKKHKIDILFSPDGFASLSIKIPQVLVIHDLAYLHFPKSMKMGHLGFYRKKMPLFYDKADHVIAVSLATKEDILKNFGPKPNELNNEISIAYNALPERGEFSDEEIISGDFFLYLGSIHPRKNIVKLLSAYELFRKKNVGLTPKMVLAGRKAFGNRDLDDYLERMHYKEDVVFLGMVSESEKYNLLRSAKLFIYISLFEGFGIPLLEAMDAGIPFVHSDDPALMEVSDGIGICVKAQDENSISEGIYKGYKDKIWRSKAIEQGKERLKDFSWERSSEKIYTEIQKLYKAN